MPAIHLVHLLLLTALALLLPLLARILAAKIPPLLVVPLLELLTLRILLPLHLVGFPLVFLVQPGIVGSVMRRACRGRAVVTDASVVVTRPVRTIGIAAVLGRAVHVSVSATLYSATAKLAGTRSCRDFRATVVYGSQEAAIAARSFKMVVLLCGRGGVAVVFSGHLLAGGPSGDSAGTTVEADAVYRGVVMDDGRVVGVVDHRDVHVAHGAVVIVISAAPVAADETDASVAEAVINAAVEADSWSPVACVPEIDTFAKSPVAGNPEVTVGSVSPVTGNPDVARSGTDRLHIDGQGGRANADGDAHGNLRLGWSGNRHDSGGKGKQENEARDTHDSHLSGVGWLSSFCSGRSMPVETTHSMKPGVAPKVARGCSKTCKKNNL